MSLKQKKCCSSLSGNFNYISTKFSINQQIKIYILLHVSMLPIVNAVNEFKPHWNKNLHFFKKIVSIFKNHNIKGLLLSWSFLFYTMPPNVYSVLFLHISLFPWSFQKEPHDHKNFCWFHQISSPRLFREG